MIVAGDTVAAAGHPNSPEQVRQQAKRSAVLVDGFLARPATAPTCAAHVLRQAPRRRLNIQALADLAGRLVNTGLPCPGACTTGKALDEPPSPTGGPGTCNQASLAC
jgi:hypothetical protein